MPLAFDRIRFLVPDSVISRPVDGITVVVDVATGRSFTLDEVGTRVWELLTTMPSAQAAYETLLQEFDADPSQVRDDVERMIEALTSKELLRIQAAFEEAGVQFTDDESGGIGVRLLNRPKLSAKATGKKR